MAPSLSPLAHESGRNDWVLIRRDFKTLATIKRGDIVTFWKPHRPGEVSIKRVVGLQGDLVIPGRGYAVDEVVRGVRRLGLNDGLGSEGEMGEGVVVPHGHVWVEGDNWRKSYDSCDIGPVSMALIDGKAVGVWRGSWWQKIKDMREERAGRTKVVEGESAVPELLLE